MESFVKLISMVDTLLAKQKSPNFEAPHLSKVVQQNICANGFFVIYWKASTFVIPPDNTRRYLCKQPLINMAIR